MPTASLDETAPPSTCAFEALRQKKSARPERRAQMMAKPTLITDFEKDGSFTIGAGETSKSEREIRNGWREPKWTTM